MHTRSILSTLMFLTLLLTSCGTFAPSTEVVQQAPSPTPRSTATPRRAAPTPRPATPTSPTATAPAVPPPATVEPAPTPQSSPTASRSGVNAVVANGGNVRRSPMTGEPLDQVHAHETVPLVGKNAAGMWYLLVTPRNISGWVSATLLTIDPARANQIPIIPETTEGQAAGSPTTDGWTTHRIGEATIQLPSDWQTTTITPEDVERMSKMGGAFNPALADSTNKLGETDQVELLNLVAMDPATGRNVNILAIPLPDDMPPDQLLSLLVSNLGNTTPNLTVLTSDSNRQVNGLPAGRTAYDLTAGAFNPAGPVRGVQWYILGARLWIITTIGPVDDDLIPLADEIAQSLTESPASGGSSPTADRRQIINGGNLRQRPEVRADNIIGQVCPGDQVVVQAGGDTPGRAAVRLAATGPDCVAERVPAGAHGWVSTSLLGPIPEAGAAALPPSLPIRTLVPFTHTSTGIAGLRPDNWTIFDNGLGFQISSSPGAPDGLIASVTEPPDAGTDGAVTLSRAMFAEFKRNHADGPPPEILKEQLDPHGNGVLLVTLSAQAQGSTQSVRLTAYLRTTVTPRGLLMVVASVPADQFPQEAALVRQMVDSVHVIE